MEPSLVTSAHHVTETRAGRVCNKSMHGRALVVLVISVRYKQRKRISNKDFFLLFFHISTNC
jgi:hypothetical protein